MAKDAAEVRHSGLQRGGVGRNGSPDGHGGVAAGQQRCGHLLVRWESHGQHTTTAPVACSATHVLNSTSGPMPHVAISPSVSSSLVLTRRRRRRELFPFAEVFHETNHHETQKFSVGANVVIGCDLGAHGTLPGAFFGHRQPRLVRCAAGHTRREGVVCCVPLATRAAVS